MEFQIFIVLSHEKWKNRESLLDRIRIFEFRNIWFIDKVYHYYHQIKHNYVSRYIFHCCYFIDCLTLRFPRYCFKIHSQKKKMKIHRSSTMGDVARWWHMSSTVSTFQKQNGGSRLEKRTCYLNHARTFDSHSLDRNWYSKWWRDE